MAEFRMPSLGAEMEAGTLVEWLKHPGDAVKRGDIIAVVDTEKGAIEIEVFEDGVLEKAVVEPGQKVPVGTVLALIRGARAPAPPKSGPGAATPVEGGPAVKMPSRTPPHEDGAGRLRISPMARKLAADLGVDLTSVEGTGTQGSVTREDVERAAALKTLDTPAPARERQLDRMLAMRTAIAAAMARSKREIPHYYLSHSIDMSAALTWLRVGNEKRPVTDRLLPAVLLLKAVALALHDAPEFNGSWLEGGFQRGAGVHLGVAISLRGGGLVAPALHDADKADLATLMIRLQDLVGRARAGTLRSSELSDATITVTNLGDQGVESTFGIIYPPQVALVAFGKIVDRPWVVSGRVDVRPVVTTTLSADHRATDGRRGGAFLAAIDRRLQAPGEL